MELGIFMGDHGLLARLQAREGIPLEEFQRGYDPITRKVIEWGGLFPFSKALAEGRVELPALDTAPRPMTMAEKILARHLVGAAAGERHVQPGDPVVVRVDGGYSHEFTTAQVHAFLVEEHGSDYTLQNPERFAVFEDHLIYADEVARMRPHLPKIEVLREMQRKFQEHTGVRDFSAENGVCAFVVGLLAAPLTPAQAATLQAMRSPIDDFRADGSEIYWLCRRKQSDSTFCNAVFERALGVRATFRSRSTLVRLAAKCASFERRSVRPAAGAG